MSFENAKNEEEKMDIWNEEFSKLDNVVDALGKGIDENIREAVVSFKLNGVPTNSSCGGHIEDSNPSFPYIQGEAECEPEYRYIGEKEIVDHIKQKYNLENTRDIFRNTEVEKEYYKATGESEETEEYKEWDLKNKPLKENVQALIQEFNLNRSLQANMPRIHLGRIYPGYRVEVDEEEEGLESDEIKRRIEMAQQEFELFAEFLKNKYFSRDNE